MVKAARMFAVYGFPVFRFDFSGCGDSEGELQSVLVDDWQQDLACAIDFFRQKTGITQCLLWGLRLGAGLALMHERSSKEIFGLILWQPVLDFSIHIKQFLRQSISSRIVRGKKDETRSPTDNDLQYDGITHVNGYPITRDLCESFNKIGNQPESIIPSVPLFLLTVSSMEEPSFLLKKYAHRLDEAGLQVTFQHATADPFWDRYWQWECREAAEATLQWLQDNCES